MPKYAKFLKELISNKRKLEEVLLVTLGKECSTLLLNQLPKKLKDPGSFIIPCLIGDLLAEKALADLGASINVMPYTMFKRLGLGEPKATKMSLQLTDRSTRYPRGIIEDVLVKVGNFIFPVDFVILDVEESVDVPLTLGRPFLATARVVIDVKNGKLALRVEKEELVIKLARCTEQPLHNDDGCLDVDLVEHEISTVLQESVSNNMLKVCLQGGSCNELSLEYIKEVATHLKAGEEVQTDAGKKVLDREDIARLRPSIKEAPELELKQLPKSL